MTPSERAAAVIAACSGDAALAVEQLAAGNTMTDEDVTALRLRAAQAEAEVARLTQELDGQRKANAFLTQQNEALRDGIDIARRDAASARKTRDRLAGEKSALMQERDELKTAIEQAVCDLPDSGVCTDAMVYRERWAASCKAVGWLEPMAALDLRRECDALRAQEEVLERASDHQHRLYMEACDERDTLRSQLDELTRQYNALWEQVERLRAANAKAREALGRAPLTGLEMVNKLLPAPEKDNVLVSPWRWTAGDMRALAEALAALSQEPPTKTVDSGSSLVGAPEPEAKPQAPAQCRHCGSANIGWTPAGDYWRCRDCNRTQCNAVYEGRLTDEIVPPAKKPQAPVTCKRCGRSMDAEPPSPSTQAQYPGLCGLCGWRLSVLAKPAAEKSRTVRRLLSWVDSPDAPAFVECPACAAKPGTPALCAECLSRRAALERAKGDGNG